MGVRLIDADALLQECEKAYNFEDRRGQLAHCISAIKAAKTIDAQPVKRGKWEHDRCTECGKSLEDLFSGEFYYDQEEVKFCPNCGARMDGKRKE